MNNHAHTSQGGSIAGFVVVGVVLAILTVGGVYFVQNRNTNQSKSPIAEKASPSPSPNQSKNKPSAPARPNNHPKSSPHNPSSATSRDLPETGPADAPLTILAVAVLFGSIVAYGQSLRYKFIHVRR